MGYIRKIWRCPVMEMFMSHRPLSTLALLIALPFALFTMPAEADIFYTGASSGANDSLPPDGTAGVLTINRPAGTVAGQALIASIAARPKGMKVTVPDGWIRMTVTQQRNGGLSTKPRGMTLLTYYHVVGAVEPESYSWTFANRVRNQRGSAVGGILAFSGIDTSSGSPIDHRGLAWRAKCTGSTNCANGYSPTLTHTTSSVTTLSPNTMLVSSISYLSAGSFSPATGSVLTFTERLDQSAPLTPRPDGVGTTIQMSTASMAAAGSTGTATAVASIDPDSGVGHLMALKPAGVDPALVMTRSGPLTSRGTASYTMTVINNGQFPEPGPLTIVDTLPPDLIYVSADGGWDCTAIGQVVTCTLAGALAPGATASPLVLNVNISAGASGTLTNTGTVSGTGGDGNMFNNTAVDSYTIATVVDLELVLTRDGPLNPGQNAMYTLDVSNVCETTEAGPLTVTVTLPAGLRYVSSSGAGWAPCTVAGQVVTCVRAGALPSDASASPLTLTVAVAANATGTKTTSASVAGTGMDINPADNSASDSYTIAADLAIAMSRGGPFVAGSNGTYRITVSNLGPSDAPGQITVTDTLPPVLSLVSALGGGWTCDAAGQVVTCTRAGSLASGESAATLTLTVQVALGTAGVITNTATVSDGTGLDTNDTNNAATDRTFFSIYAYYQMDEEKWSEAPGVVIDSSGNRHHGTALNGVTTVGTPEAGHKRDTCRGANIPADAVAAVPRGVDTGIDINDLMSDRETSTGSIGFWYRSNRAWNADTAADNRVLFDASLVERSSFWLVLRQDGRLFFQLSDPSGDIQTAAAPPLRIGAKTWIHVAVTWDFIFLRGGSMRIYVDGEQVAINSNLGSAANYSVLLIGDTRSGAGFINSANGVIDEVRIYDFAQTPEQIKADMEASHACARQAAGH